MAKLHFIYSVMNAGKTTHLLQVRYNYVENGGHVLLFTSLIDDRFGVGKVKSRGGAAAPGLGACTPGGRLVADFGGVLLGHAGCSWVPGSCRVHTVAAPFGPVGRRSRP